MSRNQTAAGPLGLNVDTTPCRKRKRPSRRGDKDDGVASNDDVASNVACTWLDRKTQYDWQVIEDPEACFEGGRFRWIDVKTSAEAQTWPVGIRFQNVRTGQVVCFDGLDLIEQDTPAAAPVQAQAKRPYPVYVWRKTVTLGSDGLIVLPG